MFRRLRFVDRIDLLRRLQSMTFQIPSYLGSFSFLDILSSLIPEYVSTHTLAADTMCSDFHKEIIVYINQTNRFGIN